MDSEQPRDYHIRRATPEDLDGIDDINRNAWDGGITTYESLEQRHGPIDGQPWVERIVYTVAARLAQPQVTIFVAEQDGRVVGYAASAIERERAPSHGPSEIGVVSYNGVAPDCRGQGIGTALIERVVDYLRAEGARVLVVSTLESDEPACHIYEKLGFEEYVRLVHYSLEEPKRES